MLTLAVYAPLSYVQPSRLSKYEELYDPDKMPDGLREAHHEMDLVVEQCYRKSPFKSDEERLEYLFRLYEKMIQAEKKAEAANA